MKNLPEFKALIERYETVTIEEIEKEWAVEGKNTANIMTGFGSCYTCTLCKSAEKDDYGMPSCRTCTWLSLTSYICSESMNAPTYDSIGDAVSQNELLIAFRDRAAYMRRVLKDGGIE